MFCGYNDVCLFAILLKDIEAILLCTLIMKTEATCCHSAGYTHTHTYTFTHIHIHTHTHTHTRTHVTATHTHMHALTHARTHAHTHTHTHTHTLSLIFSLTHIHKMGTFFIYFLVWFSRNVM